MPPEWMWSLDEELKIWFEEVDEQRKSKYGGGGGSDEITPMAGNELTKGFRD